MTAKPESSEFPGCSFPQVEKIEVLHRCWVLMLLTNSLLLKKFFWWVQQCLTILNILLMILTTFLTMLIILYYISIFAFDDISNEFVFSRTTLMTLTTSVMHLFWAPSTVDFSGKFGVHHFCSWHSAPVEEINPLFNQPIPSSMNRRVPPLCVGLSVKWSKEWDSNSGYRILSLSPNSSTNHPRIIIVLVEDIQESWTSLSGGWFSSIIIALRNCSFWNLAYSMPVGYWWTVDAGRP